MTADSYVILPEDSGAGKKQRTIVNTVSGSVLHTEVVVLQDGAAGSGSLVSPAKTEQFPTSLTASGNLKISIEETTNLLINSGSIGITGSLNASVQISGSTITLPVTGSLTSVTNVSGVQLTGSTITVPVTGSVNSTIIAVNVTQPVSGSISVIGTLPVTGSMSSITTVYNVNAVRLTGSTTTLPITGSLTSVTSITNPVGITGSITSVSTTFPITGSISGGSVGITGSANLSATLGITGSSTTLAVTGSLTSIGSITSPVGITGSLSFSGGDVGVTGSVVVSSITNPVGITGSVTTSVDNPLGVTGSLTSVGTVTTVTSITNPVGITGSVRGVVSGSGVYTYTAAQMVTGSINITGTTTTQAVTGSISNSSFGISGSVALNTSGSLVSVALTAGFGKLIITGSAGKIRVYDAGYSLPNSAYGCFYFGMSGSGGTTGSSRIFGVFSGSGTIHQTYIQPKMGNATESLWLYSNLAQSSAPVDVGYVIE